MTTAEKLFDNVDKLLASDISSYRIAKETGVRYPLISDLRNGKAKVENVPGRNLGALSDYYETLDRKGGK